MIALKTQDQGIITLSQQEYLSIVIESFLIDRKAQGLAPGTIFFYRKKLEYFLTHCEHQSVTQISQITPDLIVGTYLDLRRSITLEGSMPAFVLYGLCFFGLS